MRESTIIFKGCASDETKMSNKKIHLPVGDNKFFAPSFFSNIIRTRTRRRNSFESGIRVSVENTKYGLSANRLFICPEFARQITILLVLQ